MAVYVDDMHRYSIGKFRRMKMSHMIADTEAELHAMADKIGVAHRWVQHADRGKGWIHYDVCMAARDKAIGFGAIPITMRELSCKMAEWRLATTGAVRRYKTKETAL